MFFQVEALLPKINSPSVHLQYAKAKEAEGRYSDALKSYLKAQDYEAAIRLNLDKLEDIDEAVNLVQETKSVQGAKMVANYFQNSDDPTSAIKFLVSFFGFLFGVLHLNQFLAMTINNHFITSTFGC